MKSEIKVTSAQLESLFFLATRLGVFDIDYYRQRIGIPDEISDLEAFSQFLNSFKNGSPHFDCEKYALHHREIDRAQIRPALHYLLMGHNTSARRFRADSEAADQYAYLYDNDRIQLIFDPEFYHARYHFNETMDELELFQSFMEAHQRDHRAGIGSQTWAEYATKNPDFEDTGYSPAEHFILCKNDALPASHVPLDEPALARAIELGLFDPYYYNSMYDVPKAMGELDLFRNFVLSSRIDQRNGSPLFDCASYLEKYSDVKLSGYSAAEHYMFHGVKEGRTRFRAPKSSGDRFDALLIKKDLEQKIDCEGYRHYLGGGSDRSEIDIANSLLREASEGRNWTRFFKEQILSPDSNLFCGYSDVEYTLLLHRASQSEHKNDQKDLKKLLDRAQKLGIYNDDFYRTRYDLQGGATEVFAHFIHHNEIDLRNGSAEFDFREYANSNPTDLAGWNSAAEYYINVGSNLNPTIRPENYRPFGANDVKLNAAAGPCGKVALVLHIFYEDYIEVFGKMMEKLNFPFDVFVTTPSDTISTTVKELYSIIPSVGALFVKVTPNRGRNFAPWLVEFGKQLLEYDSFCHLHSKKSLYTGREQTEWSRYLIEYLIGDPDVAQNIARAFYEFNEWGICYPETYWRMPWWGHHWLKNASIGQILARRLGIESPGGFLMYPVGGMFWARPAAIKQLLETNFSYDDFPKEAGQTDATLQHAIERIVGPLCEQNGYKQFCYSSRENVFRRGGGDVLGPYRNLNYDTLNEYSNNFKVLSVDIFDTLVYRERIWQDYAKYCVGESLVVSGLVASPQEYIVLRNEVEMDIRRGRNFRGDVSLSEIVSVLCSKHLTRVPRFVLEREFDFDLQLLRTRTELAELINRRLTSKARVIFVSDMYYSEQQIRKILRKAGVAEGFGLYVSSETNKRKDTGEIWTAILEAESAGAHEILHVGDNMVSDVQIPADLKIGTFPLLSASDRVALQGYKFSVPVKISNISERQLAGGSVEFLGYSPFIS